MKTKEYWSDKFYEGDPVAAKNIGIIQADARAELQTLLREAHALLNDKAIAWRFGPVPWRDRRDAWNKAFEKVKGGQ